MIVVIVACLLCLEKSIGDAYGTFYLQQLLPGEWRQGVNLTSLPTADTVSFSPFSENTSTMLSPIGSIIQVFIVLL